MADPVGDSDDSYDFLYEEFEEEWVLPTLSAFGNLYTGTFWTYF